MRTKTLLILASMSFLVCCALGCGGSPSDGDYTPPVPQGNKEKSGINDTKKGSDSQTPVNPPTQHSQKPLDRDNKSTPPSNAPANGSQDSRSPATSPTGGNPPINSGTPEPKNSDLAFQKASAAVAQVRLKLQSAAASPGIMRQLEYLESGLKDLDNTKNQPTTFETLRNLVCAQSSILSLLVLSDSRLETTTKDTVDGWLESYHQAGELCGDA
jgi:hypothetical protein